MSAVDNESLDQLFGRKPLRTLARDELLFRQGDPATAVFLIARGRLRMVRHLLSGDRITIHTGRAGEVFAEGALFSETYRCDAVAAEPTRLHVCGKAEMLAAIESSSTTMLALLERISHLLHDARTMRELRNIRSADARVLQHLHLSATKAGIVVFDRPLLEVAEDIGLTREAYYRALAMLARAGAIKRNGRTIRLAAKD